MKKIMLTAIFVSLVSSTSFASPFLVCDPQSGVTYYDVQNMGTLTNPNVPAEADGSIRYDLATLPAGDYTIAVKACNASLCSDAAIFSFTKLGKPAAPSGLKITN